jgi:hypothetical protein
MGTYGDMVLMTHKITSIINPSLNSKHMDRRQEPAVTPHVVQWVVAAGLAPQLQWRSDSTDPPNLARTCTQKTRHSGRTRRRAGKPESCKGVPAPRMPPVLHPPLLQQAHSCVY